MKGLKYISFLLLLSILILIGHSMVPHHHHAGSAPHATSEECPEGDHEHHDEERSDCHAFNDLNFVKYNPSVIPAPADVSWDFIRNDPGQIKKTRFIALTVLHPLLKPPIVSAELTGTHSLRGPPVCA